MASKSARRLFSIPAASLGRAGATVTVLVAVVACGSDEAEPLAACGPEDVGCAALGAPCAATINCPVEAICNLEDEVLYDASAPSSTCIKVTCASDADCEAPKECGLARVCRTPLCQVDANCSGEEICIAGACASPPNPSTVTSCEVVTRDALLAEGQTLTLFAVAKGEGGAVIPGISFAWESSNPAAVSVVGNVASASTEAGSAELRARVGESTCTGAVSVIRLPARSPGDVRVVVVEDAEGIPVAGAQVVVDAGGLRSGATDATGAASFSGLSSPIASVTVQAEGFQRVSVIAPGVDDIFIPIPRDTVDDRAGGFRGVVDISTAPRGEIQLGFAGPALPSNLLDIGLTDLVGESISTEIDAPELDLELTGEDAVDLPGGLMAALGNRRFTVDGTGVRCQGRAVATGELGCYVAGAPEGMTAAWALAGQLRLRDVTGIAGTLSAALGGSEDEELPIGELLIGILPLLRNLSHAIVAAVDIEHHPRVGGEPDYARYQSLDLTARQDLGILSRVRIPQLPGGPGRCASAAALLAVVNLDGRGLVPLGITAGLDVDEPTETPDCVVNGLSQPFGPGSSDTEDGQLALSMAPLHSGAEAGDLVLLLAAADVDELFGDAGFTTSLLVHRPTAGVPASLSLADRAFLERPSVTIESGLRTITATAAEGAVLTRFELQGGGETWLVYAPSGERRISLPALGGGPDPVTSSLSEAFVIAMSLEGDYGEVFQLGSGKTLDRLFDTLTGLAVQTCAASEDAGCRLVP